MRGKAVRYERFGALNLRDDDLKDTDARDLLNVVGTPRGGVRTRAGSTVFGALPAKPAIGLYPMINPGSLTRGIPGHSTPLPDRTLFALVDEGDGKTQHAYSIKSDGTLIDHGTLAVLVGLTFTSLTNWGVAAAVGSVFLTNGNANGAGAPGSLSGSLVINKDGGATPQPWTSTGTMPSGTMLLWWNNRMFVAGKGARITASAIGTPFDWTGTSFSVDLEPGEPDEVVAWGAVGTYLIVFKGRRTFAIYDGDTGANRILSPTLGASGRNAVAETPYGLCWQGQDYRIYRTNGTDVTPISQAIDVALTGPAALGYSKDHLYVSIAGVGTFDHDFTTQEWRKHSFVAAQFAAQDFGPGEALYGAMGSAANGAWRFFNPAAAPASDPSGSFASYWSAAHQKFGTSVVKRISEMRLEGTGTLDVSFSKDRAAEAGARTVAMGSSWSQKRVLTPGIARSWGFKFGAASGAWSLDAYEIGVKPRAS